MSTNRSFSQRMTQVATWPPLVYFVCGGIALLFWAAGTAVQVQTSEAWIAHESVTRFPSLSTFKQVADFLNGTLPATDVVPFMFAWGVQIALIIASVGVEMPRKPEWRHTLSWVVVVVLIGVNSCGDFTYSEQYGFWGQLGFTAVILFVTFCVGLIAVMSFVHGFRKMSLQHP